MRVGVLCGMDYDEDSNIFDGIPAFDEIPDTAGESGSSSAGTLPFFPRAALEEMSREQLYSYIVDLQKQCSSMESENNFLSWEFRDYQENLTYFSRAAKLAHELNSADINDIARMGIEDIRLYFSCNYAALFLYDLEHTRFELFRSTRPEVEKELTVGRETFLSNLFANYAYPFVVTFSADHATISLDNGDVVETGVSDAWHRALGKKALVFPLRIKQGESIDPLTLGGLIIGDARRELEVRDAEIATFFADLLSSGLYNAKLLKKLNDLTIIDPLTQLYNRRHLINQLSSAMIQSSRQGHPLSVVMIDIDFFKRFNDQYGHICGDEVLRSVAGVIKNGIRTGVDVPARYGGEEFVLVMPFTDLHTAVHVANRIRSAVKDAVVRFEGKDLNVTCSFGVAQYVAGESLEHLIDRADDALYSAKKNGRDQVVSVEAS